jgi:hypothetical protein
MHSTFDERAQYLIVDRSFSLPRELRLVVSPEGYQMNERSSAVIDLF